MEPVQVLNVSKSADGMQSVGVAVFGICKAPVNGSVRSLAVPFARATALAELM